MDQTTKLLNNVAQNAEMGFNSIRHLLEKTEDENFRAELLRQWQEYRNIHHDAEMRLSALGYIATPKPVTDRAFSWMGLEMNTLADKSNAHLADLIIQGASMGVVEGTKARNENPDASAEAHGVAACFIAQQQEAIERMKKFLR